MADSRTARAEREAHNLTRRELFSALYFLGCVNGLTGRVVEAVHQLGWSDAVLGTFDISAIVLVACFAGLSLTFADETGKIEEVQFLDFAVAAILLLLIALPSAPASWLAVTLLSFYLLLSVGVAEPQRRGAIILLATTVPMLWSRLIFDLFANFILKADAYLVSWMLGTHRTGNIVEFADHSGALVIFPSCSSFANVSLAVLCWVTVSQSVRHQSRAADVFWCVLACASVVLVNVTRISLMGLSAAHYLAIHSPLGDLVANILILVITLVVSVLGVRREVFSRI